MNFNLILFINLICLVCVQSGLITDVLGTVTSDVHKIKDNIQDALTFKHHNHSNEKVKGGILSNIVNNVKKKVDKVHNGVSDLLTFNKKDKDKNNGDKKEEVNVTSPTKAPATDQIIQNNTPSVHVTDYPVNPTFTTQNNSIYNDTVEGDNVDISALIDVRRIELERTTLESVNVNQTSTNDKHSISFNNGNNKNNDQLVFFGNDEENDEVNFNEDEVIFPGKINNPSSNDETYKETNKNDTDQQNPISDQIFFQDNLPQSNKNLSDTSTNDAVVKRCAEGLVKAADGTCLEPVVIKFNTTNTTLVKAPPRNNFVGGCAPGFDRAADGSCQEVL